MMTLARWPIFALCVFSVLGTIPVPEDIVQTEVVDFGSAGQIKIQALEKSDGSSLVFASNDSGHVLQTIPIHDTHGSRLEHVRFRVLHMTNFPDPLILAIANANGASDCFYYPMPIARINGKFRRLLFASPEMDTQGGFSLGSLGSIGGSGLAVWTFEWGPKESHYDRHRYRIKFYRWDKTNREFEYAGSRLTRQLDYGVEAALESGIDDSTIVDAAGVQSWFPEYGC
jgi:hypothetical protein